MANFDSRVNFSVYLLFEVMGVCWMKNVNVVFAAVELMLVATNSTLQYLYVYRPQSRRRKPPWNVLSHKPPQNF